MYRNMCEAYEGLDDEDRNELAHVVMVIVQDRRTELDPRVRPERPRLDADDPMREETRRG